MSQSPAPAARAKLLYAVGLFENAVTRLEEALDLTPEGENSVIIDGTIQRFEFCFEMSWKTARRFLDFNGIEAKSPKECFKASFKLGWITDDEIWPKMIDDRNRTSHTYDRRIASSVYRNIPGYLDAYKGLLDKLRAMVDSDDS